MASGGLAGVAENIKANGSSNQMRSKTGDQQTGGQEKNLLVVH